MPKAFNEKSVSIRFDRELLDKFHVVADYEGRSLNAQVVYMVRKLVEQFEKEHGKIELNGK